MARFQIPEQLIDMLKQRRVIPFIGAGFSTSLGLPLWEDLLKKIPAEITDCMTYEDIKNYCNDPLQIAEYYLIECDKNIGPLRHSISHALHVNINPIMSGAHVELVNLGTPQIYTTNFDELLETAFRNLHQSAEVISLPKDVATSFGTKTQIIKYHGDLRYEPTLVLTESSYYSRLDFESPMDLKFRSDLLGRSVLFMGYSFRDINIRVIWFKLMKMMKDIPTSDRPSSYIVRFGPNPILEVLYDDVGIKTIVLDPKHEAKTPESQNELFNEFMFELALRTSNEGKIPGTNKPLFLSMHAINKIKNHRFFSDDKISSSQRRLLSVDLDNLFSILYVRRYPLELKKYMDELIIYIASNQGITLPKGVYEFFISFINRFGSSEAVTFIFCVGLCFENSLTFILELEVPWDKIWESKLNRDQVKFLLDLLEKDIKYNEEDVLGKGFQGDYDIAYRCYLAQRIYNSEIIDQDLDEEKKRAQQLLKRAKKIYKSISILSTKKSEIPDVTEIIEEIDSLNEMRADTISEDDIPF